MKYAAFDEQGVLNARYDSRINNDIPANAVEITDDLFWRTINETDGEWKRGTESGEITKRPFPAPTGEQTEAAKVAIVQRHMDDAARVYRYDNIASAITYAEEPAVPKFQAEGQAFRAWRSLVWAVCYAILADVEAGNRSIPTDTELIDELPALEIPVA